jgi:4,5-dihydroxyphthalate decarboxylase
MTGQPLTIAIGTYGVTAALKSGAVDTGRLQLEQIEISPVTKAMRRMVRGLEFDICEMAITTYLCAKDRGLAATAIPVFVTRNFHHWAAFTTVKSGIKVPKDLEGRRVAVNRGYTVTTGVWVRGIWQSEYGVDLDRITWVPTDDEHVADYGYPSNVDLSCRGKSAEDLLLSGDCAAAIGDVKSASSDIQPLIPEARQAGFAYYHRTGIYPINHTIVIRDAILDAHPWGSPALFAAFDASKHAYYTRLFAGLAQAPADVAAREIRDTLSIDPFAFGIEPNRRALQAIATFAAEQKITSRVLPVDVMFAVPG